MNYPYEDLDNLNDLVQNESNKDLHQELIDKYCKEHNLDPSGFVLDYSESYTTVDIAEI